MSRKLRGIFERPSGSRIYWIQWFDSAGKRHREKAGTKSAAIKLKAKRTTDKLEARKIPETLKYVRDVRFSELMTDAQEHANHENGLTAQSNLRGVIKALTPDFGDRIASTIATPELLNWLRRQAAKREWAGGTYNHYIIQLKVIYRIGQERVARSRRTPARALKRRTLDNDKPRYLSAGETDSLAKAFERWPQYYPAYLFARNTGLRASAQFNLKWSQVDIVRRTITLPPKRRTKYRKNRVLPFNPIAFGALLEMKVRMDGSELVFHEYHRRAYLKNPANWFPQIVKAAEVKNFTWHGLRHDFASQLVMRGVDLKTVQVLMCHADIKQTARYADLSPEHLQSSVNALMTELPGAIRTATCISEGAGFSPAISA
jgi:integrase